MTQGKLIYSSHEGGGVFTKTYGGAVWGDEGSAGAYRYRLWRHWDDDRPHVAFIMLNPSIATETIDDPTIRRVIGYAKDWGFGGVDIGNIFAYRSTDPKNLRVVGDPVGRLNDEHLYDMTRDAPLVVAAWGAHGSFRDRGRAVRALLHERRLAHLGLTASGEPRHPLYLRRDLRPQPL